MKKRIEERVEKMSKISKRPSLFGFTVITLLVFISAQLTFATAPWYEALFVRLGLPLDQILTGVGIIFGLLWTNKRIKLTEDSMKLAKRRGSVCLPRTAAA